MKLIISNVDAGCMDTPARKAAVVRTITNRLYDLGAGVVQVQIVHEDAPLAYLVPHPTLEVGDNAETPIVWLSGRRYLVYLVPEMAPEIRPEAR